MLMSTSFLLVIAFIIVITIYFKLKKVNKYHNITLNSPWYECVRSGEKRFEGHRWSDKIKTYSIGDILLIKYHTDPSMSIYKKKIVNIHRFPTFEIGLNHFNNLGLLDQVLPGVRSVFEGVNIYYKYVSLFTQTKDSVCFIELE